MIETVLWIVVLCGFAFLTILIEPFLRDRLVITCSCGRRHTYRHVIIDEREISRVSRRLSDDCADCQRELKVRKLKVKGCRATNDNLPTFQPSTFQPSTEASHADSRH